MSKAKAKVKTTAKAVPDVARILQGQGTAREPFVIPAGAYVRILYGDSGAFDIRLWPGSVLQVAVVGSKGDSVAVFGESPNVVKLVPVRWDDKLQRNVGGTE